MDDRAVAMRTMIGNSRHSGSDAWGVKKMIGTVTATLFAAIDFGDSIVD